jgi:2,4-diaminopentanoate dehydrogenase
MGYRVIQWSTGHVGLLSLRCIVEHPDLELVGLWVHSEEKAGRDAGELCGLDPVGVAATNDVDALLALDADAVMYTATGDLRPDDAVADMARILRSGKDVISTSVVPLVYPPHADAKHVAELQAACEEGGTTCLTSGIDPGFANDVLPLTLTGICARVDQVRIQEILNYETYDQAEVLLSTMGFGMPPEETPLLLLPGVLSFAWGGVVRMMADALGWELEEMREVHERADTERGFDTLVGRIEAGTMAGLRFEVQGIVDGQPKIVVEHVTRMHDDIAPEWPQAEGQGGYRIQIEGNPNVRCDFHAEGRDGDHNTGGLIVTAMRLLNALPQVKAAPPGLISALDLGLVPGGRLR